MNELLSFDNMIFFCLGTLLCFAGFVRRPKNGTELMMPRFVVPGIIWLFCFLPYIVRALLLTEPDRYTGWRNQYTTATLFYFSCCVCAFWIGFLIIWRRLNSFDRSTQEADLISFKWNEANDSKAMGWAVMLSLIAFLILFAARGMVVFNNTYHQLVFTSHFGADDPILNYIVLFFVNPICVISSVLLGFAWPTDKKSRTPGIIFCCLLVLFVASIPLVAKFSRGAGLTPLLTIFAYIIKSGRLPKLTLLAGFLWAAIAAENGIIGRGIYGHYAGIFPFFENLFINFELSAESLFQNFLFVMESYTPFCTTMAALNSGQDIGVMNPFAWLRFQIPIPSFLGLRGGEFTLDLAQFVGGNKQSYLPGMFGDTFAHFSYFGSVLFIYVGGCFAIVSKLAKKCDPWMLALLPPAYMSLILGCFNGYRTWNSGFTFPLLGILIIRWFFVRLFRRTDNTPSI